jgi:hypothetical protein
MDARQEIFHYFIKPKEIAIVAVPIIPINRKI